jgi:hypothetical protein
VQPCTAPPIPEQTCSIRDPTGSALAEARRPTHDLRRVGGCLAQNGHMSDLVDPNLPTLDHGRDKGCISLEVASANLNWRVS